ncbi:MAG: M28 family peptidase [Planctomycetes bacterium]|nr:M28 family peptidase [Planctomycetota bacterium]
MKLLLLPALALLSVLQGPPASLPAAGPAARLSRTKLLDHVAVLADDAMEGRRTGTPGAEKARAYLLKEITALGLPPIAEKYEIPFQAKRGNREISGVNLAAKIEGKERKDLWIVITAHYDHEGMSKPRAAATSPAPPSGSAGSARSEDWIFNGADDNASGTAAILEIARYFKAHPPRTSLLFVWFDAEERGLIGSREFCKNLPVPKESILTNVNLDMVSRNEKGELWACGTRYYPDLKPFVESVASRAAVTLRIGHDGENGPGRDDWMPLSDHGSFHAVGIRALYFGVEDHADYHKVTDEFSRIQPDFYHRATETILDAILAFDAGLMPAK